MMMVLCRVYYWYAVHVIIETFPEIVCMWHRPEIDEHIAKYTLATFPKLNSNSFHHI